MTAEQWKGIPVLAETDIVISGGSLEDILTARKLAEEGEKVLLALPESYLLPELWDTFHFEATPGMRAFFPEEIRRGNLILPDEGKKYAEDFCLRQGIQLLYGVYFLDACCFEDRKCLRFGAKGGVFAVLCREWRESSGKKLFQGKNPVAYRVMIKKVSDSGFDVLEVSGEVFHEEETDHASFLQKMQAAAMDAFLEKRKENDGLVLGRFAPRCDLRGGQPGKRICRQEEVSFFTGNEFLKWDRYPLLGGAGRAAKRLSVMACTEQYDIVIAGGGTAGAMAALYAARGGLRTVIVEPQYVLGGTATAGGVSTYWFGSRFRDVLEIDAETDRMMERLFAERRKGIWSGSDDFHPSVRAFVLQKLCLEAGVEIRYGQLCFGAVCDEEETTFTRIKGVVAAGEKGVTAYMGDCVIDATGDGDIAVFCGAKTVYGSRTDCITYWASLAQYVDARAYKNNFSTMVISADPADMTRFIIKARRLGEGLLDHGRYVSMRESRHLLAKSVVNLKDLMGFRTWEDGLYTCYSNYDPKGKLDADLVYCGVLPPQTQIQIPLSALIPLREDGRQIEGLYVAGKAIGATHNVFPSIRMQPDLMHQGAVLGGLLAFCKKEKIKPEELDAGKRRNFVWELTGDPLTLPQGCSEQRSGDREFLKKAVESLKETSRTHWVDVPFTYTETGHPEMLTVMLADSAEASVLLKERILRDTKPYDWKGRKTEKEGEDRIPLRILLIGCCLWHGEDELAGEYADYLMEQLTGDTLPARKASVMCAQLLPDHGVMPEVVYGMNLLGRSKSPAAEPVFARVLELLAKDRRDYTDIRSGIFHYVESFARASQWGESPVWEEWLQRLLDFEEIARAGDTGQTVCASQKVSAGKGTEEKLLEERLLILKLILCRALADRGNRRGLDELRLLAENPCGAIACSAKMALWQEEKESPWKSLSGRNNTVNY